MKTTHLVEIRKGFYANPRESNWKAKASRLDARTQTSSKASAGKAIHAPTPKRRLEKSDREQKGALWITMLMFLAAILALIATYCWVKAAGLGINGNVLWEQNAVHYSQTDIYDVTTIRRGYDVFIHHSPSTYEKVLPKGSYMQASSTLANTGLSEIIKDAGKRIEEETAKTPTIKQLRVIGVDNNSKEVYTAVWTASEPKEIHVLLKDSPGTDPKGTAAFEQGQPLAFIADTQDHMIYGLGSKGQINFQAPIGVGADNSPTPKGAYLVKEPAFLESLKPQGSDSEAGRSDGLTDDKTMNDRESESASQQYGAYGPVWIGLSKPSYGIHGTSDPSSIGQNRSAGCIRMHNSDVEQLSKRISPGDLLLIR